MYSALLVNALATGWWSFGGPKTAPAKKAPLAPDQYTRPPSKAWTLSLCLP